MGRFRRVGRRFGTTVAVVSMAMAASNVLASPATAHPSTADKDWQVSAVLGLGSGSSAVSCPTTSLCWAIEAGELLRSGDGGQTWDDQTGVVPSTVRALSDVTCPSSTVCYLTAMVRHGIPEVIVIDPLGVSEYAVPDTKPLPTISCASATRCMATDGQAVFVTNDAAATWSTYSLPQIVYTVPGLDCVKATKVCWVVGDNGETPIIETTVDGGRTWHSQLAPGSTDGLYDVDCPSTTTCYAVGADFFENSIVIGTHDGGDTWSFQDVPPETYAVRSVSCASVDVCRAAGQDPASAPFLFATTDGGAHWTSQNLPSQTSGGPPKLSCPSVDVCSAVSGGLTFSTRDGGTQWTASSVPAVVGTPTGLSCSTSTHCVGVADDALYRPAALVSNDGGSSWDRFDLPARATRVWDVECPTAAMCYAISSGTPQSPARIVSHALWSDDGGETWHFGSLADSGGVLRRLTCPSATTCMAEGFDRHSAAKIVVTTDSGATWSTVTPPEHAFYADGLSCSSVDSCVLVAHYFNEAPVAWTTADLGATFQQHDIPGDTDVDYFDLSCEGRTCVAVGANGGSAALATSGDGGATWRSRSVPVGVDFLERVSCGSARACVATGFGPLLVGSTDRGHTWHLLTLPARDQASDVACHQTACIASDTSSTGNPLILAGPA